jgi:hypothetical protein
MPKLKQDPIQRLAKKSVLDLETGCILWNGCTTYGGYPLTEADGKTITVQRLVWKLTHSAELPPNSLISQKCRNKLCINPGHLFVVRKKYAKAK